MNQYELLYIVPTQYTDEEIVGIQTKISELVEKFGGKVLRNDSLGKIRLAYSIKKIRHGTYVLVHFNGEPSEIQELDRQLKLAEEVLRHTIVMREDDALEKEYQISSYVAPLSEEARAQKKEMPRTTFSAPVSTPVTTTVKEIAPPTPSATSTEESKMSIEELDKKLDEILDTDLTEKI